MNILKYLKYCNKDTLVNELIRNHDWVSNEEYEDLKIKYDRLKDESFKTKQVLEDELLTVNTNYSNYVDEKIKEIDTFISLKATLESLEDTVSSLNTERDSLLERVKGLKNLHEHEVSLKRKIIEETETLEDKIHSYSTLNKYLWTLLFISICGNFYQSFI